MANYNQPQTIYLSSYLKAQALNALAEISALTKSALTNDAAAFTKKLISRYQVPLLELGHYKAVILETSPNKVEVKWPVKGDTQVLRMATDDHKSVGNKFINGNHLIELLVYPVPLSENEYNRNAAKQAIEKTTTLYQRHIERLNAQIEAHNQQLADKLPESVKLKYEALAKLKAAEDFLN
jgi:hypothetical protein